MDKILYRARLKVPRQLLDALAEATALMEPPPSSWEDVETGEAHLETFDADRIALAQRARAMADIAQALDGRVRAATIDQLAEEDWSEAWKRYFHATRVSERLVVKPSWEEFEASDTDIVIEIDPGLSFGTGLHPTTRSCLRIMDRVSSSINDPGLLRVTDLGCGSGILSIAAAKLGFAKVAALDNDPVAARVTKENLALNNIPPSIVSCDVADLYLDHLPTGELVFANVLAPVLLETAAYISASVAQSPHASLILSGVLDSQFAAVREAYARHGFVPADDILESEWRTGRFIRKENT